MHILGLSVSSHVKEFLGNGVGTYVNFKGKMLTTRGLGEG